MRARAARFADEWEGETYEKGESQSFWTDFLDVFGVSRRRAGGFFERAVKLRGGKHGFIDMLLPGRLLAEQKSAGRDLTKATGQALSYLDGLDDHDLPELVVASDFATFQVLDLETRATTSFTLAQLPDYVETFGVLFGKKAVTVEEQSPVNREAAELMAELYLQLEASGYSGHKLQMFMVRLMFCNFADDSHIFPRKAFEKYIRNRTHVDGTDLGPRLGKLFEVLRTRPEDRAKTLDEDLAAFPYINGGLFNEPIPVPDFDAVMRIKLLATAKPDWSGVSPAIFGAMFQGVMDPETRHELGAHYTSEENILRVIKPLFLDDLYLEFEKAKDNKKQREAFHDKLASLQLLDPACGCGNFLVIAYRELRRLEHRVVKAGLRNTTLADLDELLRVRVEQFHGIEIEEFPALIANTALWLTDHQMNREAGRDMGVPYNRIPLTDGANIVHANALTTSWADVVDPTKISYIIGNPPFLGSRKMDATQKKELRAVAKGFKEAGFLDFVTGWYILASRFMDENPAIETAFVSTNSLSQGEQPGILWEPLYRAGNHITFAHRTFRWTNNAKGVAQVHCVVVGFARKPRKTVQLFEYPEGGDQEPVLRLVDALSPYLIPGGEYVVRNRHTQISGMPEMAFGNMPADGGNLIIKTREERDELITKYPETEAWVHPFPGAEEFINGGERWCLWLEGVTPGQMKAVPPVYERVKANRETRAQSSRPHLADTPHLFAQRTQSPEKSFLLIPSVSSERRPYVPMGFFEPGTVASNLCLVVEDAEPWLFALMTSQMHMDWLRTVGGRLESRYRYSKDVVYNNFVFPPLDVTAKARLGELAEAILDARAVFATDTLADLYDPVAMPAALREAHRQLDTFVDGLYRSSPFADAEERVAHLLHLHAEAAAA